MKIIYLHGFASGPESRKARFFRERLLAVGVEVTIPDLAEGDFENLTITGQLAVVQKLIGDVPVRLIGSSMGGYLAALLATRQPELVEKLLLLAPAFNFAKRWPNIVSQTEMRLWISTGRLPVFHYAEGRLRNLGVAMFHDSQKWEGAPDVRQPALIFHGVNDTIAPIEASREFADGKSNVQLVEVQSDHELLDVLEDIWTASTEFLLS